MLEVSSATSVSVQQEVVAVRESRRVICRLGGQTVMSLTHTHAPSLTPKRESVFCVVAERRENKKKKK